MSQLEILGRRADLDAVLRTLQRLKKVQLSATPAIGAAVNRDGTDHPTQRADATASPGGVSGEERGRVTQLRDRVEALLAVAATPGTDAAPAARRIADSELLALLAPVEAEVADLVAARDALRSEAELLPRYVAALGDLEPLVPELNGLTDAELAAAHLASVALVLDDPDRRVITQLTEQLTDAVGQQHLLVTTRTPGSGTVGALLVTSLDRVATVNRLLGSDQISEVTVPGRFSGRSLSSTVAAMRAELADLPALLARNAEALAETVRPAVPVLLAARRDLAARLERLEAAELAAWGDRTFALRAWVPRPAITAVEQVLREQVPGSVVVEVDRPAESAPVLLRNPGLARPFERLVGFLAWPRHGELDPTVLMAVVFPFLFGVMVGDAGYGVVLVVIGVLLRRRLAERSPFLADVAQVLVIGGCWSVLFGLLFGELLGSFGRYAFGFPAVWFYRGSPDALTPLLLFVVAIGATHILLGLILGVWSSVRSKHLRHAAERLGTLVVLIGLFGVAAVAVAGLPPTLMTPSLALLVIGRVVAVLAPGGAAGLLAPLELIGTVGKILSYLRLAAVGLASVYLAVVANELAAAAPLVLGIIVAAFFHALNLALAAFSPMIQSLRLHYVEFFPNFYEGGGQPFTAFGADIEEPADGQPVEGQEGAAPAPAVRTAGAAPAGSDRAKEAAVTS
jgi:V/A-type H+-transporting ATPase subunit I